MSFEITEKCFLIDGKPAFLLSGEIHYFRIAPGIWDDHLHKLKASGALAVSTYIPWSWHEYEKDVFDFTGKRDGSTNLVAWLKAVQNKGLYCVVKPGPYMLAEYEDKGIPEWLTDDHEILSEQVEMITYMHPRYLERVRAWYDRIFEVLKPFQIDEGGPLIMMQICNEIGLFNWLAGSADYSAVVAEHYRSFLERYFGEIGRLNGVYGENHGSFTTVQPPRDAPSTLPALAKWLDFHEFHRHYFADYLGLLEAEVRARGITVPFYHNIAGWVYGHALEYPVNISMYHRIAEKSPATLLAADHIPEYVNYRNIHHGTLVTKAIGALKNGRELSYVAEMQAGTREDNVITYPNELELFYKKCLADGVKGMNLYMFSQGRNPDRKGAFGPTFYWQTALDADGRELPLYDTVSRLGKFLQSFGETFVQAKRKARVALAVYWPYWRTEFLYPLFERKSLFNAAQLDLDFDLKSTREAVFVDTWLKLLSWENVACDLLDLSTVTAEELSSYSTVLALTLPFMDRKAQEKLRSYAEGGGSLFFTPSLPRWNCAFQPCAVLADAFGLERGEKLATCKIDCHHYRSISCTGPLYGIKVNGPAEPLATIAGGTELCGVRKRYGKGSFVYMSALFSHMTAEHADIFYHLLGIEPAGGTWKGSRPALMKSIINGDSGSWLFVANVHSMPVTEAFSAPELLEEEIPLSIAPKASLLAPLMMVLPGGRGVLRYSTADLLSLCLEENRLTLEVFREKGALSHLSLELPFTPLSLYEGSHSSFSVDGKGRTNVTLSHSGKVERLILSGS
jgi:beta-galactosidase